MFKQLGKSYFKPAALFVFLFLSVLWLGQTDAFAATYTVTNANDSGVGSLRWALTQAGTDANGTIVFDTTLAGRTITLQSDLTLWNNATQTGTTMGSTSGNFSLTGLTDASGAPSITIDGGGNRGIWASGTGTFSISNVKFKNFQYTDTSGFHDNYGSVITLWGNAYSTVNLTNVVFDSNIGVYGLWGGIVSLMANTPSSDINVDRCVFSNNSIIADQNASNPHMVTQLYTSCTGNVLVSNSLFHDNSSLAKAGTSYGSAMSLSGSMNAYVYNNTFVNNAVTNSGVGARGSVVYFETSLLYSYNNIMFGNTANGSIDNYYGSGSMSSGSNLTPADLSLFVDAANKNFRLASGASAAIDKGDNTHTAGTYDLAGAPRKNGTVDIGAYEYYPAPLVTQVSPSGGPVTGGTSLSILGSNFDNVTSVMFGGNAAAFSRQSSGQILATAPPGSLGNVNVTVTTAGGASAATIYSTYDYLPPTISSATYDANTGTLTVTGANLCAGSSISVNKLTLTGEGGSSYILTTPNVSTTSNTTFSVTLNAADKAAVNQILNKNGSSSTSGTTFNLAAADDWDSAVTDGNTADATNTLTVNNAAVPTISSAAYNAAAGTLTVTGTGFLAYAGLANDIDVSKLTLVGEGGSTYTLTDSADVDIISGTFFNVALSTTDKAALNMLVNKNGSTSTGGTTYSLKAGEDWASGADAAVVIVDMAGNPVTVSNVAIPTISGASYDKATGILTITGTDFVKLSGANNDVDVNRLTIVGEGGATYTLTDSLSAEITSGTVFTVTLSTTDKAAVDSIINKNGTTSTDGTPYNLAAAEDWARGADTAVTVADLTGNVITANNVNFSPVITITKPFNDLLYNGTQTITVSGTVTDADKQTVTVSATINGKTKSTSIDTNTDSAWTLTWNISSLSISDGTYTGISFDADDGSGGTASATYNGNITVDTQAPDTTIVTCPSNPSNASSGDFTFSSTDTNATFEASLNGASFSPSTSPISFTGLAEGSHTFSVRAVDAAGNKDSTPASYTWTVDYTGPTVSISTPSAIITTSGSITYTIAYTGADTITLNAGDITLNTTGTANGSVSVSGTGDTSRTVTISGISGDGTIGISIAAGTASDNIGNTALAAGPSSPFTVDNTAPTGTLSINNGAAYTTDQQVTLSITSSDGAGSGVNQMRFSLDAASWSPWQNISDTKTGNLAAEYGIVTVYMQLRDNAGNISGNISDTIVYKASPVSSGVTKYGCEDEKISLSGSDFKYNSGDGSTLKEIKIETLPAHGTLMLDNTEISISQSINSGDLNRIVFVPATNWNGSDSFTWTGYDGTLWTDIAEIRFMLSPVNDAPVAVDTSITINADTPGSGTLTATDVEGNALTFERVTQGTKGTLVITDPAKGSFLYTPIIGEFGEDIVTFRVYDQQAYSTPGAITVHIVPASDADLAALSISSGTLTPAAFSASITDYGATVANSVNSITVTASAKGSHSTIKINGITVTSGSPSNGINLSVGKNNVTIEVIAQDGTRKTYTLHITRETSSSVDDSNSGSRSSDTVINTPDDGVNIQFNGEAMKAGTLNTHTDAAGQTVATVTVDQQKLEKKLAEARGNCVITIFVPDKPDVAAAELNGQMLSSLKSKQSTLEIKTGSAAYALPAAQINIDAISAQLGSPAQLSDIKVSIKVSRAPHETAKALENMVKSGKFSIVAPPVDFTVECTYGGRNVFISTFNAYVERMLAIPDGVDPSSITTGIVIDTDGTVRHVPTKIVTINGKYFAKINSLTNSSYAVIRHPLQFDDTEKHWSKDAVNDMGSRMIITGVGEGMYEPDRDITRAEFAAIIVRALGLKPGTGSNPFTDVKDGMWYTDYIKTTYQYNIISGYSDNTFRPTDKITREQAMAMVAKAMKLTGLKIQSGDDVETQNILSAFTDLEEVSAWAKDGMAACVRTGIISGRSNGLAAPKANVTRAEVAVMIKKLLQKSNLI